MEEALAAIEASPVAQTMRRSVWLYPIANVLHVLGVMTFFTAVAAMDVKALRGSSAADVCAFILRIRPLAITLLVVQGITGIMLFLPEASHIAHNVAFQAKVATILLALLNVLALEAALGRPSPVAAPSASVRLAAVTSLALWLAVAALGRLIAYF
jgi:heme A synthase